MLCAVYTVHKETRSMGFLVEPQNHGWRFVSSLASKPWLTVCQWFGLKTTGTGFPVWATKPAATVWWFMPQNHHDGFLICALKPCGLWFVGCATEPMGRRRRRKHTSRSSGLLWHEASQDRVSQSSLKTGGGAARIVHVTSSQRLIRVETKDGRVDVMSYIRPFYPNFAVFIVLGSKGILVF
jgi:hypothetical protein